jgi:hypothetical protein
MSCLYSGGIKSLESFKDATKLAECSKRLVKVKRINNPIHFLWLQLFCDCNLWRWYHHAWWRFVFNKLNLFVLQLFRWKKRRLEKSER